MQCPKCQHDNRAERRFCAQCGAALPTTCAACGAANEPGERFCGERGASLAASRDNDAEAEDCFRRAVDCARRQGAKGPELSAALRLSRLWRDRGKNQDARTLLAEIYNWFTEGFDTVDLKEAKALLDEWSQGR